MYKTTIGLEIHAELKTRTKMFCNSLNNPDEKEPNVNICPVCMGHPGTLPAINKEAVKHVLKIGIAVGGELADFTEFDRKNYFYPDIPKGYQLSQYKYPLVKGGQLAGVQLTRIHLEEDTARSSHDNMGKGTQGSQDSQDGVDFSLVDFNRAGVPLMELVTEPVIHSPEEAVCFARELQLLLQTLGVGEANMEKGEMRVEANISVATEEDTAAGRFGTKVEVKNLNSFRAAERAIRYEVDRHIRLLEKAAGATGGDVSSKVVQETRGWDEAKQVTFSQRAKEDSHDYRYFPDPDLPKLYLSEVPEFSHEALKADMAELPWTKRERYQKQFELKSDDAELFVSNIAVGNYFESVVAALKISNTAIIKLVSNYISSDYLGLLKAAGDLGYATLGKIEPVNFAELIGMIADGKLTSRAAKDILAIMYGESGQGQSEGGEEGGGKRGAEAQKPEVIAQAKGMLQKNDEGELKRIMADIIAANPKPVADYKAGKTVALQSLIGQGMKATKGSANPEVLKKIAIELLS